MKSSILPVPVAACAIAAILSGTAAADGEPDRSGIWLELPVLELPYNTDHGYRVPGMQQALAVSTDGYQVLHLAAEQLLDPWRSRGWTRFAAIALVTGLDVLSFRLPLFAGWQHEEAHRAILGRHGIDSHDGIYDILELSLEVGVTGVTDDQLAQLKAADPAEFVRLAAAGIEANYELATQVEKTRFFHQTRTFDAPLLVALYAVNSLYWAGCVTSNAHDAEQDPDVSRRDFVGLDCTSWIYDLTRPDEPYAARGLDPNGGIRRYRSADDLTSHERSYLKRQLALSALNFLDPQILGVDAFTVGAATRLNASVRYEPTSFGSDAAVNLMVSTGALGVFATAHAYGNDGHVFPGISAELVRYPIHVTDEIALVVSGRLAGWRQPRGQRFATADADTGGLAGVRIGVPLHGIEAYADIQLKSAGWVASEPNLGSGVTTLAGLAMPLFR